MMTRSVAFLLAVIVTGAGKAGDDAKKDVIARVEYVLKSPRSRDPVLGGERDKAFNSTSNRGMIASEGSRWPYQR